MDGASEERRRLDHATNRNDDNLLTSGREDDSQNNNVTSLANNEMTTAEHPIDTDKNNDNVDNVDFEEEEEEPETQESFTQHEMTQTGNELTQMGLFDDDDDDDGNNCNDDEDGENSQQEPMIDPLTLPWGRLMPVGSNGSGDNPINNSTTAASNATTAAASSANTTSLQRPSTREPIEMLPRPPESRTITRSRSPSLDNGRLSNENNDCSSSHSHSQNNEDYGLTFMGLKNLVPSDRFNEYVLGRSVKVRLRLL